jgi:hypothetical protein
MSIRCGCDGGDPRGAGEWFVQSERVANEPAAGHFYLKRGIESYLREARCSAGLINAP